MLSPTLFTIFINEFSELIENGGIAGVELFPEDIQVLILLFDDVVNVVKTKVVVFKKGGRIST